MLHPLQMLDGSHSLFGEGQARYSGFDTGGKSDRLEVTGGQWSEWHFIFVRGRLHIVE